MIGKIILLVVFVALSVWMLTVNCKIAQTKTQIIIGLGLWILGFYIGLGASSLLWHN
jgi:hypothetical protein